MNVADLMSLLQAQTAGSLPANKFILRFRSASHFRQSLAWVKQTRASRGAWQWIRPIQAIRGFLCDIPAPDILARYRGVLDIERDRKISLRGLPVNLPAFAPRTGKRRLISPIPWGVQKINAKDAWPRATGTNVKIAVIDTGADFSHPDLRNCLAYGVNMLRPFTLPQDDNGHGTHIAGTIAANGGENGIVGVAPRASIYPVKAFDHTGSAYVSDIILGIDWCIRNRINIINMSFGMDGRSQALTDAVVHAHRSGLVVVASSGNEGKTSSVDYPARLRSTIAVGATNKAGRIAKFSNRGPKVDIYAPGDRITSTWTNGRYNTLNGTSMATSHVSGILALMLEANPSLSPTRLKSLLKKAVIPIRASRTPGKAKIGQLSADLAVKLAQREK